MGIKIGNYAITRNGIAKMIDKFQNTPDEYFKEPGSSLDGKVALVTGGYKGIGLAIVRSFLREGARVIFTGRNMDEMEKTYNSFTNKTNAAYMKWDIADKENCGSLMKKAFGLFGAIDVLVNNAGVVTTDADLFKRKNFLETDDEYIKYIHSINVFGTIAMCNTFLEYAVEGKSQIINIISNTAFKPASDAYGLSKWALLSYTHGFNRQCKDKVIIDGIAPGPVMTDMSFKKGSSSLIWVNIANKRIGLPEEIAELAVMLAGKKGDLISGKVFLCDGGEVLK